MEENDKNRTYCFDKKFMDFPDNSRIMIHDELLAQLNHFEEKATYWLSQPTEDRLFWQTYQKILGELKEEIENGYFMEMYTSVKERYDKRRKEERSSGAT